MKQTLILLHGGLGNARSLEEIEKHFSGDWDVVNSDFPGHGSRSQEDVHFSIDLFTDHLHQLILTRGIENPVVFGYSMGGYVALNHALKHPGVIRKVITYGTKLRWNPDEALEQIHYLDPAMIREKVPHYAAILKERHGENWEKVVSNTALFIEELGQEPSVTPQSAVYIVTPVYLLRGTEDWMVTDSESERFVSCAPNGKFIPVKGLPHEIERVDCAALCASLNALL